MMKKETMDAIEAKEAIDAIEAIEAKAPLSGKQTYRPSPFGGGIKRAGLCFLFLLLLLLLSSCSMRPKNGYDKDGQLQGRVTLSGAFALYPLAVEWGTALRRCSSSPS